MSTAATESSTTEGSNAALGIKAFVVNIGGIGQFFRQRPAINAGGLHISTAEFRHQAGPEEVLQGEFVYYLLGVTVTFLVGILRYFRWRKVSNRISSEGS